MELQWTHITWSLSSQPIGASVGSTENTAYSIVACWTVFIELLSGNALIKPIKMHCAFSPLNYYLMLFLLLLLLLLLLLSLSLSSSSSSSHRLQLWLCNYYYFIIIIITQMLWIVLFCLFVCLIFRAHFEIGPCGVNIQINNNCIIIIERLGPLAWSVWVNMKLRIFRHLIGLLGTENTLSLARYLCSIAMNIHALTGTRNHDPNVRASEQRHFVPLWPACVRATKWHSPLRPATVH
jgi:hypothetical protein